MEECARVCVDNTMGSPFALSLIVHLDHEVSRRCDHSRPLLGPVLSRHQREVQAEGSSSSYSHTKIVPESSYPSNPVPSSGPKTGSQMELAMESGTGSGSVAQPILVLPQATVVENGQPSPVSPNVVPDAYTLSPSPSSPSDPFDETLGTLKGMTASLNNVATKLDDIQRVLEKQQLAILEALRAAVSVNVSVSRRKGRKDRTRRGKAKEPSQGQMAPPGKEE
ncbi:hypothetical protein B0O80DRAFT_119111 [Mortierella sp. GBAus27b]|nr:hypothetical protein B0O80DRAFT_119111 [Mortierella sp. GBAus27b]